MAWDDTKQTADNPQNPSGIEQLTAAEWNAMVSDQKSRIKNIRVLDNGQLLAETDTLSFGFDFSVAEGAGGEAQIEVSDTLEIVELIADIVDADEITSATSFTDPAGVEHTGELADIDDASAEKTITPPGVEIEDGSAVSMGVPVANGDELSITSWGIRTSEGTTPSGLTLQLVNDSGTVLAEENTSFNPNVSVSELNDSGSPSWYYFRFENATGTDIISENTPDAVFGSIAYEVM